MATPREDAFDNTVVKAAEKIQKYSDMKTSDVPGKVASASITLPNGKVRELGKTIGWIDNNVNAGFAKLEGMLDGLIQTVAATATNPGITEESIRAALDEAAQKAFGTFELELKRKTEEEGNPE